MGDASGNDSATNEYIRIEDANDSSDDSYYDEENVLEPLLSTNNNDDQFVDAEDNSDNNENSFICDEALFHEMCTCIYACLIVLDLVRCSYAMESAMMALFLLTSK